MIMNHDYKCQKCGGGFRTITDTKKVRKRWLMQVSIVPITIFIIISVLWALLTK